VPGVLWWHTANGGRRDRVEAAKLKKMGVLPGVADLLFLYRGHFYSLELKIAAGGRVSEEQLAWRDAVNSNGGFACVARGLDEALQTLTMWGLLRGSTT